MKQKIIRVGNSAAVTIPKKFLLEKRLKIGDYVDMEMYPEGKYPKKELEFLKRIDKYLKIYEPALKELARK